MNRVIYLLVALVMLQGCALSTVKNPKKKAAAPAREIAVEEDVYTPRPAAIPVVSYEREKETALPTREKEEMLPLGSRDEDTK